MPPGVLLKCAGKRTLELEHGALDGLMRGAAAIGADERLATGWPRSP